MNPRKTAGRARAHLRHVVAAAMLGGAALMSSAGARAVELAGVQFPQQVNVASKPLQLNGAGVRYKAVFKVYAAGLYVPAKTASATEAVATDTPKRLSITMLRDIEAQSNKANDTLQKASRAGLEAQQMGATMLQKAKQRAEAIETTAQAQAQKNKDEARRLHEEKQRLQDWADQLKMSAEKIAKNTAHMVEIVVPGAPSAPAPTPSFDSAAGHKRPEAAPLWTGSMPGPG